MSLASELIATLGLQRHPEGGYFRETHRSSQRVQRADGQMRDAATAIYYLLERGDFSAWHRIRSDEVWLFHLGAALAIHMLDGAVPSTHILGHPLEHPGAALQCVVPAGVWFAAEPLPGTPSTGESSDCTLVSCTVSPGFEFADFELASAQREWPPHGVEPTPLLQRLLRAQN